MEFGRLDIELVLIAKCHRVLILIIDIDAHKRKKEKIIDIGTYFEQRTEWRM